MSREEFVKIERLRPFDRNVNLVVKVVDIGEEREVTSRRDGSTHRVAEALVGDETGCIWLTLWDDNIDKVSVGSVFEIRNGYVSLFRGSMRLNVGRRGTIKPVEVEISEVNTSNNLSERRPRMPRIPDSVLKGAGARKPGKRRKRR